MDAFHRAVAWDLPEDPTIVREAVGQGRQLLAAHGVDAPPMQDWDGLRRYLDDLFEGRAHIGDDERSREIATAALAVEWPPAGIVPAFAVVARWEGPSRDMLLRTSDGARHWGWHGLALPLARALVRADATWGAAVLTDVALGVVSMASDRLPLGFRTQYLDEAVDGFREIRREVERRHELARDDLAWDIRRACRRPDAPLRAVVAALWWTLGSPWQAAAVASGRLVPTLRQMKGIVDAALFSLGNDSMLGAVADQLWNVPGLDDARSGRLRRRLGIALATAEYERLEAPFRPYGASPSRRFANILVAWMSGRVDPEAPQVLAGLADALETTVPRAAIRLRALQLILGPDDGAAWRDLAARASSLVAEENWNASENPYDRAVDLPLHYLEGNPDERLAALERQRAAALTYSHVVERTQAAREADDPRGDRHELLALVRGARLVAQLPVLPPFLTRAYSTLRSADFQPSATERQWSDVEAAVGELSQLRRRLDAITGDAVEETTAQPMHQFSTALEKS